MKLDKVLAPLRRRSCWCGRPRPASSEGTWVVSQMNAIREADEYLKAVRDRLLAQGLSDVDTSVWFGPAAPAIIEAAETQKPDLIVMNSHGRGGLGRLVLGSVAEAVLRGTRTPILLLREPGAPIEKSPGVARPVEPTST